MSSEENLDEHVAKRIRKNEEESAVVETVEDQTLTTKSADADSAPTCLLCMEEGTSLNPLLADHQCPQCAPGSWTVCHVCNEALLSRLCPVCRAEYAPITMHIMPGLPFRKLADATLGDEEKSSLLYKFGIIRQMIAKSNVCVWSPSKERMFFSLPSKFIDKDSSESPNYIVTSIPMADADAGKEIFSFTNRIWDMIENEVENGAVQAGESVDFQGASQYILNQTREDGHRLFTMLSPSDWDYMLNPDTSNDITDTLRSIRMNILQHVERIIPKRQDENSSSQN